MTWKDRELADNISKNNIDKAITLYGWVDAIRDHGGLLFIHLRDVSGIVQVVFDPVTNPKTFKKAESLRSEYVIQVTGTVLARSEENCNPHIKNGDIEVSAELMTILNSAETPPFLVSEKDLFSDSDSETHYVDEDIRLKYRYIDLRRRSMQENMLGRAKIIQCIRRYLEENHFNEFETPMLTKSTPEGARDYLVPSRTHEAKFFALPQSPQLFKQLLMVSGFEKYYQIVKCFRDEDLRPNRQPEFTQMDLEASFIDQEYIFTLMEGLMTEIYKKQGKDISTPFPRMTYADAMDKYGSDKPELRVDMPMVDVTKIFADCGYKIFQSIVKGGGLIKGMIIPGQAEALSKNVLQNEFAMKLIQTFGGKGMTWMKLQNGEFESNIVQFFSAEQLNQAKEALNAKDGDVLVFVADTNHKLVNEVLGKFRLYIAQRQDLIDKNAIAPCWITDFPLFEEKDGKMQSMHHPFTQPSGPIPENKDKILALTANAYDLVINGEEIGGGSMRIHDPKEQWKVFNLLGLTEDEIEAKFGFFTKALGYGTPPHGGIALGVDRLVSMLLGTESIREVIPFPKNRVAYCPLTEAPSEVSTEQLTELQIKVIQKAEPSLKEKKT